MTRAMSKPDEDYFTWQLYSKGNYDITQDLMELFSSEQRDFLIRNNGDQVSVSIEHCSRLTFQLRTSILENAIFYCNLEISFFIIIGDQLISMHVLAL